MRATRAYIAGFGTAGSLLAGAAIAFVLASAIVAVRGWPQIGYHASVSSLRLAAPRPSPRSAPVVHLAPRKPATVRRSATHAATPVARATYTAPSTGTVAPHATQPARAHSSFTATPTVTPKRRPPTPSPRATSTPSTAASTPRCDSCSSSSPTTPASPSLTNQVTGVVQGATNTLQNTVTTTSQNLGSTVNKVVGGLP